MAFIVQLTSLAPTSGSALTVSTAFSTVYVGPQATLAGSYGINVLVADIDLDIAGHVVGETYGISWGISTMTSAGNMLIEAGASVGGGNSGLYILGSFSAVNLGTVFALNGTAVTGFADFGLTTRFENHGTVAGGAGFAFLLTNSDDTVMNFGTITGKVYLGSGDDLFDTSQGFFAGRISMGTGNDSVYGGAGSEVFGADTLGATTQDGNDEFDGGGGFDTYDLKPMNAAITVDLAAGFARSAEIGTDLLTSVENAYGGSGSDDMTGSNAANVLRGNLGDDSIYGGGGNDRLFGGGGRNVIFGGDGNDRISGGDGVDMLNGGNGDDRIFGSYDVDRMTGGAGRDVFVFNELEESFAITGTGFDIITDFVAGTDRIDLSTYDTDALTGGDQAYVFVGTAVLTNYGQVRFHAAGGNTLIELNPFNNGPGVDVIKILGLVTLTAADFIL